MNNIKKLSTFFVGLTLLVCVGLCAEQIYQIKTPDYRIETTADGFHKIVMAGFHAQGISGYPDLPERIYRAAVAPEIDPASIEITYKKGKVKNLGLFNIREVPPMTTWADGKIITADKTDVYSRDDFFPGNCVQYAGFSRLRKWRIVSFRYSPFQYNPVTGELKVIKDAQVTIVYKVYKVYKKGGKTKALDFELSDALMDYRVDDYVMNYEESLSWYPTAQNIGKTRVSPGYAIITTNAIESSSTKLGDFVTYLTGKGLTPQVITEDDFGSLTGQAPDGTAEKIRKWLQDNYIARGIKYVLLIGNPDPDDPANGSDTVGDIPMKMCWPRHGAGSYEESPTDSFYADLSGNWDVDGDLYYGEWEDFAAAGGVDFANEVYVGRIPVYSGGVANLDAILTKTITYGQATDVSWRKSILLPMSFLSATYDGAPLAQQMMDDFLIAAGYSTWTMYQQGGGACSLNSSYTSDEELRGGTVVRDRWAANDYGLVTWWAHGVTARAIVGYTGCDDGYLMDYTYSPALDDSHPAVVYQGSCYNGLPENSLNLQYALLKNGAVAAVSATRVSWHNEAIGYGDFDGSTTNSGIGFEFTERIVAQQSAAEALCNAKAAMLPEADSRLMNFYDFNLYGDPAVCIATSAPALNITAPNGGESWKLGSSHDITWTAQGVTGNLKITLWKNSSWLGVIADDVSPAAGFYAWAVGAYSGGTAAAGTGYSVKIKERGTTVGDSGDGEFTLTGITVSSPNGGEAWQIGTSRDITWSSAGLTGNIKITLYRYGVLLGVIADNIDPAVGHYLWTVGQHSGGAAPAGSGYKIKIKEKSTAFADSSDATFTLQN